MKKFRKENLISISFLVILLIIFSGTATYYNNNGEIYNLTFRNISNTSMTVAQDRNATYYFNITNNDNVTRIYNITSTGAVKINGSIILELNITPFNTSTIKIDISNSTKGTMENPIYAILSNNSNIILNSTDDIGILLITIIVDNLPPSTITSLTNISKTNHSILWNWTIPADTDFNSSIIYINSIWTANTTNNFFNSTNLTANTNYTITVRTKDHSGNINNTDINQTTSTLESEIPPKIEYIYPAGGQNLSGTFYINATITDINGNTTITSVLFYWSANNGSTWNYIGNDTNNSDAHYSTTWNTTLLQDNRGYILMVNASDNIHSSINLSANFTIDNNAPSPNSVSVSILSGLSSTSAINLNFTWSPAFSDSYSGIKRYYYNTTNNAGTTGGFLDYRTGDILHEINASGEGAYYVYVWAEDYSGNIGYAANDSIFVDNLAPKINFISPSSNQSTNDNTPQIIINISEQGAGLNINSLIIHINNTPYNWTNLSSRCTNYSGNIYCSIQINSQIKDGIIPINVSAADSLQNNNQTFITFYLNTIPPNYNNNTIGISNTTLTSGDRIYMWTNWSDDLGLNTIWLTKSNSEIAINTTNISATNYFVNLSYLTSEEDVGTIQFILHANDSYGNINQTSPLSVVITDNTAPVLNLITPGNNSQINNSFFTFIFNVTESTPTTPFCSFMLSNGQTVINTSNRTAAQRTSVSNNIYSYTIQFIEMANTNYNLTLNCTDLSNRKSSIIQSFNITDTTSPLITSLTTSTSGTSTVTLIMSATTNENSICKYSSTNINYSSMPYFMDGTTTNHTKTFEYTDDTSNVQYYVLCNDSNGNTMTNPSSLMYSIAITNNQESESFGSSGGGGGTFVKTTGESTSKFWNIIKENETVRMDIESKKIPLDELYVTLATKATEVEISVNEVKTLPGSINKVKNAYNYFEISTTGLFQGDISQAKIIFNVNKTWIESMAIKQEQVVLLRYTDKWTELPTKLTSSWSLYNTYEATSTGFSHFAISYTNLIKQEPLPEKNESTQLAEPKKTPEISPEKVIPDQNLTPVVSSETTTFHNIKTKSLLPYIIIIVTIIASIAFFIYKKMFIRGNYDESTRLIIDRELEEHGINISHDQLDKIEDYIQKSLSLGRSKKEVRDILIDGGWAPSIIDEVLKRI